MTQFRHLAPNTPERTALEGLRNNVETYLATEVLLHFTDHGLGHSDRMVDIVDELIQPVQSGLTPLSLPELTIIYTACFLHDLGMHVEKLDGLACLPAQWTNLSETGKKEFIRESHHLISAELIDKAARSVGPCSRLNVAGLHSDQVACLCEAHNLWIEKPANVARYEELTKEVSGKRMSFLAALLRIADILDESQARACIAKAKILDLDLAAQQHWWRHYYTEHIAFSQSDHRITMEFKFPQNREDEYASIVTELQYPKVTAEFGRHTYVLAKNSCTWSLHKCVQSGTHSTKEQMPDEVQLAMLTDLQSRRAERQEQDRIAALKDLREARPLIERQSVELQGRKAAMTTTDFVVAALSLYRRLWQAGGKRTAWMSFTRIYDEAKESLPDEARFDCECQLSTWKRECGFSFTTAGELKKLQPKAESPGVSPALRSRFYRELFLCLYDLGIYYRDALAAAKKALAFAATLSERCAILAEMTEMAFLVAEPTDALVFLQDNESLFVDGTSEDAIRCKLLRWRLTAMRGESAAVIADITLFANKLTTPDKTPALVRCLLLKAELLCLCGNLPAASAVFRDELWNHIRFLPVETSITIAGCYQEVALNAFEKKPLIGFYELVDERMAANVKYEEASQIVEGLDAAAEDKHYDAMAELIVSTRSAYHSDNWSALKRAFTRLARESVSTKSLHDATFYAVLARDNNVVKTVANSMHACTESSVRERAVNALLEFAHLPMHAEAACTLFESIADVIPDATMPGLIRYLRQCTEVRTEGGFSATGIAGTAWTAMKAIAERIDSPTAQEIVETVLRTDLAAQNVMLRWKITPFLQGVVTKMGIGQIEALTEATISMVTDRKHDIDFVDSAELLSALASHIPATLKAQVATRVYPPGKEIANGILLQMANQFDVGPSSEELAVFTHWVLERLSTEVVTMPRETEAPKSDRSSMDRLVGDNRVVTYSIPVAQVWGLVRNIERVTARDRSTILALLVMNLMNQEDTVSNKRSILGILPQYLTACNAEERRGVIQSVAQVASERAPWPTGIQTPEQANNPLERYRLNVGNVEELQGDAILCLSRLNDSYPEQAQGVGIVDILENGFASNSDYVRQRSFRGAQQQVPLSPRSLMQVLIGTRDESPIAAATAFHVFLDNRTIPLVDFAEILCCSLRYAVRSPAKTLRQTAARLVSRFLEEPIPKHLLEEMTALAETLRQDRSWTVRNAMQTAKGDNC